MKVNITTILFLLGCLSHGLAQNQNGVNFAMNFDGLTGWMDMSSPLEGNADFTFEALFIAGGELGCGGNNGRRIISWEDRWIEVTVCGRELQFYDGAQWIATGMTVKEGEWNHVALVREKPNFLLYLNGNLVHSHKNMHVLNMQEPFHIGTVRARGRARETKWVGLLDEVRIWSVPLSAERVAALNGVYLNGNEPNLAGYWTFNDGVTGNQLTDYSPNKNHGKLKMVKNPVQWMPGAPLVALEKGPKTSKVVDLIQGAYDDVDVSTMKTDFLWNRGFIIDEYLRELRRPSGIIEASAFEWGIIYEAVANSQVQGTSSMAKLEDLMEVEVPTDYDLPIIPVAILNMEGDIQVQKSTSPAPTLELLSIFAGSPVRSYSPQGKVGFYISPELYFSNVDPGANLLSPGSSRNEIKIDLGDGAGFRKVDLSEPTVIFANYPEAGEYEIRFQMEHGDQAIDASSWFEVWKKDPLINASSGKIETPLVMNWKQFHGAAKAAQLDRTVEGDYFYVESRDSVLDKPVILLQGFDLFENKTARDFYFKYGDLTEKLIANGYDVFTLNFADDNRSILENSNVLYDLINYIIKQKVGNEEGIIIGRGVGGVIARVTLAYCERVKVDHGFGLYVSHDAPHKGANIPMGLQWLFHDAYESMPPQLLSILWLNMGLAKEHPHMESPAGYFKKIHKRLNSEALKEILSRHYLVESEIEDTPGLSFRRLQTVLDSIGYPKESRNVALVSGSNLGVEQGVSPQDPIVPGISYGLGKNLKIQLDAWFAGVNVDNQLVSQFELGSTKPAKRSRSFKKMSYSNAPGAYLNPLIGYNETKFCFVPTVSAIDIYQSIINRPGLDFYNANKEYVLHYNISPFDDIYASEDNRMYGSYGATDGAKSLKCFTEFETQELMFDNRFIQNETFTRERSFEASNTLIAGFKVNGRPYSNKFISAGDVSVEKDADVIFRAGGEVRLKPGFVAKRGSTFRATVLPKQ